MDLNAQSHKALLEFTVDLTGWVEAEPEVRALAESFFHAGFAMGRKYLARELQVKLGERVEAKAKEAR